MTSRKIVISFPSATVRTKTKTEAEAKTKAHRCAHPLLASGELLAGGGSTFLVFLACFAHLGSKGREKRSDFVSSPPKASSKFLLLVVHAPPTDFLRAATLVAAAPAVVFFFFVVVVVVVVVVVAVAVAASTTPVSIFVGVECHRFLFH